MALKLRDQKFLDEYFANGFNGTEALITVSPADTFSNRASAASTAWKILQRADVKEEIDRRYVEWRVRTQLTVDQFGQMLQDAVKVEISDFLNEDGSMKTWAEIPPHARRQVASIEFDRVADEHPVTGEITYKLIPKIKLWDKNKDKELWGKWKKMYTDKVEHAGEGGGPVRVSFSITGIKKG